MMLILGVGLGAAGRTLELALGGRIAGIVATALYALAPNFLGHAPDREK